MTVPQGPPASRRSEADDVERRPCPQCDAQPGSPCRARSGAVASAYHTGRFTKVPRLAKLLRVPTPDRGPGQPWRPGTPPPAPIDPDLPGAGATFTFMPPLSAFTFMPPLSALTWKAVEFRRSGDAGRSELAEEAAVFGLGRRLTIIRVRGR